MVQPMEWIPRKKNPSTTSTALTIHMNTPTFHCGKRVDSMMDRPEVPPNAKWLGRFKNGNSYCGEDQSQIENQEKNQVVFCKYFLFHKFYSPSLDILSIT